MIIAIDGTASSGKGTLAKNLAEHFKIPYFNTGALYRLIAFRILTQKVEIKNFENFLPSLVNHEFLANKNLSLIAKELEKDELFSEEVGAVASEVAKSKKLRAELFDFQRNFVAIAKKNFGGCVLDGRDTTTVICPDADFKFFITAEVEIRAKRRQLQLGLKNYEEILNSLKKRDDNDFNRAESPLKIAPDAHIINNSKLSAQDCLLCTLEIINRK